MRCLSCGHQTDEGMEFCDPICEENHTLALPDDQDDAGDTPSDPADSEPYQDEPDARTLARLIRQH